MAFYGQDDAVVDIVGAIGGNINVSVLGGAVYSIPLDIPQGRVSTACSPKSV